MFKNIRHSVKRLTDRECSQFTVLIDEPFFVCLLKKLALWPPICGYSITNLFFHSYIKSCFNKFDFGLIFMVMIKVRYFEIAEKERIIM